MKAYILTYHFAKNYGALLQCWALQEALKPLLNDVTVLNFQDMNQIKNNSLYKQNSGVKRIVKNIVYLPYHKQREEKYKKFEDFMSSQLICTPHISTLNELNDFLTKEEPGIIFVGSDQVWNPKIDDFSKAFFLPFQLNHIKATYAASVGPTTLEEIDCFKNYILDFQHISIREKNTAETLEKILNRSVTIVPDPVFLISKEKWIDMSNKFTCSIIPKGKYMLCYYLNKKHMIQYCKISEEIAKKRNLKVVNIIGGICPIYYKPNSIRNAGPTDFLSLIKNAELVCTDSFHGTAFSLIYGKDFYSFDYQSSGTDSRKKALLEIVGLKDRYVTLDCPNICQNEIDAHYLIRKLNVLKAEGLDFLYSVINK